MQTTTTLTRQLRNDTPVWTSCSLPEGRNSPLVKSGVLVHGGLLPYVDCKCNDCDSTPKPFIRNEGDPNPQWAFTCVLSGETVNIDEDLVHDWRYDADRFAEIVCERLECECVQKIKDNLWRLGHSQIPETEGREIVITTRFRKSEAESIHDYIDGQAFILLVGSMECDVQDDQFRRRIYTFDQVVRFRADGTMDFVLNEFVNRFEERVVRKRRRQRSEASDRTRDIMRVLKDRFFQILPLDDYKAIQDALNNFRNVSVIAKSLRIPKSSMSRYIHPKWTIGQPESVIQFWYNVTTREDYFYPFASIVKSRQREMQSLSPEELHAELYRLFIAEKTKKQNRM